MAAHIQYSVPISWSCTLRYDLRDLTFWMQMRDLRTLDLEPEPGMRVSLEVELLFLLHFGFAPEVWPHLELLHRDGRSLRIFNAENSRISCPQEKQPGWCCTWGRTWGSSLLLPLRPSPPNLLAWAGVHLGLRSQGGVWGLTWPPELRKPLPGAVNILSPVTVTVGEGWPTGPARLVYSRSLPSFPDGCSLQALCLRWFPQEF